MAVAGVCGGLAVVAVVVGCGVSTRPAASDSSRCRAEAGVGATAAPGNRTAALREDERLLRSARLPPGAVDVAAEPRGDGRVLDKPPQWTTGNRIDCYAWWRSRASLTAVLAFLAAHRPPGSRGKGSGELGGPGIPRNHDLGFDLPPLGQAVSFRTLLFDVVALRGGGTGVRVDAQDGWVVPRPASERIPAGIHELDVHDARPGKPAILSRSISDSATIQKIITLLNKMEIVQPGVTSCPDLLSGQPIVTLDFRTRAGGPIVARASETDYGFPSGPCNPVSLTIRGHAQKRLLGGTLLAQLQLLLDTRLR